MILTVKALLIALLLGGALLVWGLGLGLPIPGVAAMAVEALVGLLLPGAAFPLFFCGLVFLLLFRPAGGSGGGGRPADVHRAVTALNGPLQGRSYSLTEREPVLTFGRNGCSVLFPPNTPGVSGNHCRVYLRGGSAVLEDEGSRYGTFLMPGGQWLAPHQPHPLADGMQFCLASPAVSFRYTETPAQPYPHS